jgi:predicted alpha-1,2-mannosidase
MKQLAAFFLSWILMMAVTAQQKTGLVNHFLGTGAHGHTYPGATLPFGMVQLSPDNGTQGWDWCSGYHYSDTVIAGFSHTHLNGTGIGDWCDISVMPFSVNAVSQVPDTAAIRSSFAHQNETAMPGFYSVAFNNGIKAAFTATERSGWHRYQFPAGKLNGLRFDLGFAINWDAPTETFAWHSGNNVVEGYRISTGWAKNQRVYFSAVLSQPFTAVHYRLNKQRFYPEPNKPLQAGWPKGKDVKVVLLFNDLNGQPVFMKVGLSSVSIEKARLNREEQPGFDFENTHQKAAARWNKLLGICEAKAKDKDVLQSFYTALYRTMLAPNLYSDVDGAYKNQQGVTATMPAGQQRYTIFSLWDTFRALNPLFTVLQPRQSVAFINSLLSFYKENGLLPVWDISTWEANTMTGYHAIPVIADAILKKMKGFDYQLGFDAMKKSAFQKQRGTPAYIQYGHLPQDKHGWSATITLEYAYDDWCIARVAKQLGHQADYELFIKRAASYKNIFDSQTGFMRSKKSDGSWVMPFDPYQSEHGFDGQYIEGTAWQHSFFVPHDVRGLAGMYAQANGLENKLDSLWNVSSKMTGDNVSVDVSGLIGQYAHGNEPSHHIAYMYAFLGKPWKTQQAVRMIMDSLYKNTPEGLCGNDDCGQMSAWYVWSAMGLYPANPASGEYILGSPLLDEVTINLESRKRFTIKALNNSAQNKYVKSVRLNGKPYTRTFITHQQLTAGGELIFEMTNQPVERKYSADELPYSMTVNPKN